jgi:type I restriction enzyme M protein
VSGRISQSELESYLWGAATLLRGTIDAGEYKSFIFPLLFLKRLSDVHAEETAQALEDSDGDVDYAEMPEQHRFQIPKQSRWEHLRTTSSNIGKAIQQAMRGIERDNPRLLGVFGDAAWTNKDRLPDSTLRDLIEHFSGLTLSIANVPEDELGVAYEYLIKRFADDSGHTAAEFYTNRTLVHLMTRMLDIQPGESVYDPTCGSGGMLVSAAVELRRQGKEHRTLKLYGQERNLTTSAIARMNLFLHGIENFDVVRGDTLSAPAFLDGDRLRRFDVILANPPYSISQWDRSAFTSDPWGRNLYGTPPQGRADYAFWQHIITSMDPKTGRSAALWPHGVLFRNEEADLRRNMLAADVIEAVIGLGPNLFYNSPMEACIVICRSRKSAYQKGKVLFIDALDQVTRERAQSFLTEEHIARITGIYDAFEGVPGFATVATLDQISANNGNLSIPLYVTRNNGDSSAITFDQALADWRQSSAAVRSSASDLLSLLNRAPS